MGENRFRPPQDHRRQLARLAAGLFIDLISIVAHGFSDDLITGLVFLTIVSESSRVEQARAPDDRAAGPAAVGARVIADRLGVSFETARRHIRRLRSDGYCETCAEGVFVVVGAFETPAIRRLRTQSWKAALDFTEAAQTFGFIGGHAFSHRLDDTHGLRRRLIDFLLDALAAGRALGLTTVQAVVMRAVWLANTRAFLAGGSDPGGFASLHAVPGDDLRQPVSAYQVAKMLCLPYETVRRTLASLVQRELVIATGEGQWMVPARVSASEAVLQLVADVAQAAGILLDSLAASAPD